MPQSTPRSSVHLDVGEATQPAAVLDPEAPFRILVLGDFSARTQHNERTALAGRRTVPVDCDNFDDVMGRMEVRLDLPRAALRFRELEDFHPDRLYRAAPVFEQLENLRPPVARQQAMPGGSLLE